MPDKNSQNTAIRVTDRTEYENLRRGCNELLEQQKNLLRAGRQDEAEKLWPAIEDARNAMKAYKIDD